MNIGDFLIRNQNEGIIQNSFHFIRIRRHISGSIASVKLHAFHHDQIRLHGLGFFYGDDTLVADFFHRLGDQVANIRIICGDGCNLLDSGRAFDGFGKLFEALDSSLSCSHNAFFQNHGVCARSNILQALANHRLRHEGCRRRTIAGDIIGLGRNFSYQLRAHIFKGVFQLNFLRDGNAVVRDERRAEFFIQHDVSALGPERRLYRISQLIDAALQCAARIFTVFNLFCHGASPPLLLYNCQNICLLDDDELLAIQLDFCARIFGINHAVALFDIHRDLLAIHNAARPYGDNFCHLGLFLCAGCQHQAALRYFLNFNRLDDNSIRQRF